MRAGAVVVLLGITALEGYLVIRRKHHNPDARLTQLARNDRMGRFVIGTLRPAIEGIRALVCCCSAPALFA